MSANSLSIRAACQSLSQGILGVSRCCARRWRSDTPLLHHSQKQRTIIYSTTHFCWSMKQNDVKTHYKKPKHDLFIPKCTGDEELHFGVTPHLGTLSGPAGRVVVVPAGAAGSSSLTERHGSGALEQLGQQLEHQRYDHDPQHRIGPLPLRPPAPNAPMNCAAPTPHA
ncbi:hypothetical protein DPX16_4012 [Anabarilius grahami]|uniref:Uncharacterized protein n=1 Tax=Anabarilius grahami TaxID=495550 RepID=A0A3N0XLH6_ANAGA|nr:hypothetical protein DPX16_4012 [Anabarilius grahami]